MERLLYSWQWKSEGVINSREGGISEIGRWADSVVETVVCFVSRC